MGPAHIVWGESVPDVFRHYYEGRLISGVFNSKTTQKGATEARERLHFIGFVNEKSYEAGAMGPAIQFIANRNLFNTVDKAREALAGWPLGKPDILNAPAKTAPAHLLSSLRRCLASPSARRPSSRSFSRQNGALPPGMFSRAR